MHFLFQRKLYDTITNMPMWTNLLMCIRTYCSKAVDDAVICVNVAAFVLAL